MRQTFRSGLTAMFVAAAMIPVASADGPFRDLGFEAALAEAKKAERVVFVDFYTTRCGPCKMLDRSTWKDEGVIKFLNEKTVALKIDAEKEVELAK